MTLQIRHEQPADVQAIEQVTEAAFKQAEHSSHTEHFIVNALRDAGALSVSLVALRDGVIVGHVAASPVLINGRDLNVYGLAPVSVHPDYQQQGIGSALVRQLLAEVEGLAATACVVLGEPRYYRRFGFQADARLVLPGVPAEYFQVLSFADGVPEGEVTFHAAFDAIE